LTLTPPCRPAGLLFRVIFALTDREAVAQDDVHAFRCSRSSLVVVALIGGPDVVSI
jgi:hypothetical protein